jgi:hypothetical protein
MAEAIRPRSAPETVTAGPAGGISAEGCRAADVAASRVPAGWSVSATPRLEATSS